MTAIGNCKSTTDDIIKTTIKNMTMMSTDLGILKKKKKLNKF